MDENSRDQRGHHANRTLGSMAAPGCERARPAREPGRRSVLSIPTIVNATGFLYCTTTTTTTTITTPPSAPPPPPPPSSLAPSPTTTTSIVGHYHGNRRMRILTSVQPTVSTCQVVQVLANDCCHPRSTSPPRLILPGKRIREYVREKFVESARRSSRGSRRLQHRPFFFFSTEIAGIKRLLRAGKRACVKKRAELP